MPSERDPVVAAADSLRPEPAIHDASGRGILALPLALAVFGACLLVAAPPGTGPAGFATRGFPVVAALGLALSSRFRRRPTSDALQGEGRPAGHAVSNVDILYGGIIVAWTLAAAWSGIALDPAAGLVAAGAFMGAVALRNRPRPLAAAAGLLTAALVARTVFRGSPWTEAAPSVGLVFLAWGLADALRRRASESLETLRELERRNSALLELSIRDALTGLLNRRALYELGTAQVASSLRYGDELHVLMFDIDHFKKVNDSLGHAVGDEVLKGISRTAQACLRDSDQLARYGGEEFVAILPRTRLEDANHVANRLRDTVMHAGFQKVPWQITVSIGVAALRPDDDFARLVERADSFLYMSKQTGRNRVSGG